MWGKKTCPELKSILGQVKHIPHQVKLGWVRNPLPGVSIPKFIGYTSLKFEGTVVRGSINIKDNRGKNILFNQMIISLLNEYQSKTRIAHYLNEKLAGDHKLGLIKHIMSI